MLPTKRKSQFFGRNLGLLVAIACLIVLGLELPKSADSLESAIWCGIAGLGVVLGLGAQWAAARDDK